jgi:hypothetical protein
MTFKTAGLFQKKITIILIKNKKFLDSETIRNIRLSSFESSFFRMKTKIIISLGMQLDYRIIFNTKKTFLANKIAVISYKTKTNFKKKYKTKSTCG